MKRQGNGREWKRKEEGVKNREEKKRRGREDNRREEKKSYLLFLLHLLHLLFFLRFFLFLQGNQLQIVQRAAMQLPRFSGKPLSRSVESHLVEKVLEAFNGAFIDPQSKQLQVTGVIVSGHEKLCRNLLYEKLPADVKKQVLKVRK